MPSIDFSKFEEVVGLVDVGKALGLDAHRFNPLFLRMRCPVCQNRDQRCCRVNWDKDEWYCHRCQRGGGPIQLAAIVLGKGPYEAVTIICNRLGIDVPYRQRVRTRRYRDRSGEIIGDTDEDDALA